MMITRLLFAGRCGVRSNSSSNNNSIRSLLTNHQERQAGRRIFYANYNCAVYRQQPLNYNYYCSSFSTLAKDKNKDNGASSVDENKDLLVVSILGPPNAGKSTLFNRFMCKESNKAYKLLSDKKRHRFSNKKTSHYSKSQIIMNESGNKKGGKHPKNKKRLSVTGGALVSPVPGTTRDRRECIGRIGDVYFRLIDTAGIDRERIDHLDNTSRSNKNPIMMIPQTKTMLVNEEALDKYNNFKNSHTNRKLVEKHMHRSMMEQTLVAIKESDLILLMFDAKIGMTSDLNITAKWLRKLLSSSSDHHSQQQQAPRRVLLLANKLEGDHWKYSNDDFESSSSMVMDNLLEATRIGFGDAVPISAEHGEGMTDIADVICEMLQEKEHNNNKHQLSSGETEADDSNHRAEAEDMPHLLQAQEDNDLTADNSTTTEDSQQQRRQKEKENKPIQLAILGRQNVGKSTLVNTLLQHDRVITGPMPGLTRDAISVEWSWRNNAKEEENETDNKSLNNDDVYPIKLVDTAGIRKLSQRDNTNIVENMALLDTMRAMKIADVAVLVIDAMAYRLHRQELAIIDAILKEGRPLIIVANKMDLLVTDCNNDATSDTEDDTAISASQQEEKDDKHLDNNNHRKTNKKISKKHKARQRLMKQINFYDDDYYLDYDDDDDDDDYYDDDDIPYSYTKDEFTEGVRTQVEGRIPMLRNIPIIAMSSLTGEGVEDLMPMVIQTKERWERTISTGVLNRWLQDVLIQHPPPMIKKKGSKTKRPIKIKYIIQKKGKPPTFLLFCNSSNSREKLPESYIRYLLKHFQDTFEMYGMEIRMIIKQSSTVEQNPFGNGPNQRKRGGSGLGGDVARKKRLIQQLKTTGSPKGKQKRKRRNN